MGEGVQSHNRGVDALETEGIPKSRPCKSAAGALRDPQSGVSSAMPLFPSGYAALPSTLYDPQLPVPVRCPECVVWNTDLAAELGVSEDPELYGGNRIPDSLTPLATAYAGHQFGQFTMLGDGRAVLLGDAETAAGKRFEVQLKGSGRTRYSRGGDGRAALEPMLREYLISEAMYALGIPTTRSLCVVATGEKVLREQALPGAVLTRVAASHLRVGTFEYASAFQDERTLHALLTFAVGEGEPVSALDFFRQVLKRQAALVAKWMAVGFVHGVMNTDNTAISGETIDYGPCAFLDRYDPETVFSSIDQQGRYAYGNQPRILHWNLAVLAGTLLPLMHEKGETAEARAREQLDRFPEIFREAWQREMNAKLGLASVHPGDDQLVGDLLELMHKQQRDFTATFSMLHPGQPLSGLEDWHARWTARLAEEKAGEDPLRRMHRHNPVVIPRNHQVEAALEAAGQGDLAPCRRLRALLQDPFNREKDFGDLLRPPPADAAPYVTFCGT